MDEALRAYYGSGIELGRLERGYWRLEFARTKELLLRYLPPAPARVLDVGGGRSRQRAAGRFTAEEGDARSLAELDDSYDVVLLLGPLYHLVERDDRLRALAESRRVLRARGLLAAAAISRFGPLLDAFARDTLDEDMWAFVERVLIEGRHVPGRDPDLFTTAYFHLADELETEVQEAGFGVDGVFGIEGPGWLRLATLDDKDGFETAVRVARAVEQKRAVIGASAHLLAIAWKP